jgi:hypothetical protein
MLQAKRFYLDQLKHGPKSHRTIMNNMANKFQVSTAKIRDELLKEGLIVADQYKNIGLTDKRNYAYRLTGKKLSQDTQDVTYWSDGLVKSTGNAFDWRSKESSLLSKQDIANAKNAGRPHNYNPHPITTFSRA